MKTIQGSKLQVLEKFHESFEPLSQSIGWTLLLEDLVVELCSDTAKVFSVRDVLTFLPTLNSREKVDGFRYHNYSYFYIRRSHGIHQQLLALGSASTVQPNPKYQPLARTIPISVSTQATTTTSLA